MTAPLYWMIASCSYKTLLHNEQITSVLVLVQVSRMFVMGRFLLIWTHCNLAECVFMWLLMLKLLTYLASGSISRMRIRVTHWICNHDLKLLQACNKSVSRREELPKRATIFIPRRHGRRADNPYSVLILRSWSNRFAFLSGLYYVKIQLLQATVFVFWLLLGCKSDLGRYHELRERAQIFQSLTKLSSEISMLGAGLPLAVLQQLKALPHGCEGRQKCSWSHLICVLTKKILEIFWKRKSKRKWEFLWLVINGSGHKDSFFCLRDKKNVGSCNMRNTDIEETRSDSCPHILGQLTFCVAYINAILGAYMQPQWLTRYAVISRYSLTASNDRMQDASCISQILWTQEPAAELQIFWQSVQWEWESKKGLIWYTMHLVLRPCMDAQIMCVNRCSYIQYWHCLISFQRKTGIAMPGLWCLYKE